MDGLKSFGNAESWLVSRGGVGHKCPPSKWRIGRHPHTISDVIYVMDSKGKKVEFVQCSRCGAKRIIAVLLSSARQYLAGLSKLKQAEIREIKNILAGFSYVLQAIARG